MKGNIVHQELIFQWQHFVDQNLENIKNLQHLNKALEEISTVKVSLSELELIAEKLKIAQRNIAMLLDNEDDDRVLSGIFSNFCIGK